MGSPSTETGHVQAEYQHQVRLTSDFYLGRYEVTQDEWQAVMGDNPSQFADCGGTCPVERVSFGDIQDFLGRLSATGGWTFRLPTEAEWEYACRAGTTTPFHTGANLTTDEANYNGAYPYDEYPAGVARPHRSRSAASSPTPGACSTCTATSGNGRPTTIVLILITWIETPWRRARRRGRSSAGAVGTSTATAPAARAGTPIARRIWGSVLVFEWFVTSTDPLTRFGGTACLVWFRLA